METLERNLRTTWRYLVSSRAIWGGGVEGITYKLIRLIILHEQNPFIPIPQPAGQLLKDLLLRQRDLLRAILVAIRAHLPFPLGIENRRETRRFERLEDEA